VYEIGSDFVTGGTELAARARSVCVVDLRRNVRVEVRRGHDTAVYRCTVEDPVAVARARRTFAVRDLPRFLARSGSVRIPGLRVVLARLYVPSRYSHPVFASDDDDDYTEA